jgi:DNA-binding PadR family transcriptional regulator
VSLSTKELAVLSILAPGEELYGLQIVEQSGGLLGRGTVYVTLAEMEERKLISSRPVHSIDRSLPIPRRLYRIASAGSQLYGQQGAH